MTNTGKHINWHWRARSSLFIVERLLQVRITRAEPGRNSSSTTLTFSLFAENHSIDHAIREAVPASHFEAAKLTDE